MSAALSFALAALLAAAPAPPPAAPADPRAEADRLVAEGAALGNEGRWDDAIARFTEADALFPRAIHACNIGLAHARAGRPEHALVHLTSCQARATEPLPPWVAKRIDETRKTLIAGDYAPLELVADTPGARVTLSHFGALAFTPPATVWLPRGEHTLRAEAAGYTPLEERLVVTPRAPLRRVVSLDLMPVATPEPAPEPGPEPTPEPVAEPAPPLDVQAPEAADPQLPAWIVLATGGAALATSGIFYGLALSTKADAEGLEPGPDYDAERETFATQRDLAYGFLGAGVAITAVGVVLALVLDEADADAALSPGPGGALVRLRF